jgi:hypothetical protein
VRKLEAWRVRFLLSDSGAAHSLFSKIFSKKKKKKSLTHSLSFLSSITAVGAAELDKIITKNEFVLVEFYAVSVR